MTLLARPNRRRPLVLHSAVAAEMMTPSVLSFARHTPIAKAASLLAHHGLDAAPVVDALGRPTGLVTAAACAAWEEFSRRSLAQRAASSPDWTGVGEIASPRIEVLPRHASSAAVIDALAQRGARRVYVVDEAGALLGVVSMSDVLRRLSAHGRRPPRSGAAHLC